MTGAARKIPVSQKAPAMRPARIAALLTRLSRKDLCISSGKGAAPVLARRDGAAVARLHAGLVAAMRQMDLVAPASGNVLAVSASGRAWLRRYNAASDPFHCQHGEIEQRPFTVDGRVETLDVNAAESPLTWLRRRKSRAGVPLIDDYQFAAGERLRADFTKAGLTPSITASWSPVAGRTKRRSGGPAGAADLLDAAIAARTRLDRALGAVGPELGGVLLDVCCFLKGLEEAERDRDWPVRSGKLILQLALTRLARHYGMGPAPSGATARRTRHWGTEDYRPEIGGS